MADIQFSDNAGKSIDGVPDRITSLGSLAQYLIREPLHLLVIPDLAKVSNDKLSQASKDRPLKFELGLEHAFQLGAANPEVEFTPQSKVAFALDAVSGDDLFAQEPFEVACTIPENTGYACLSLTGAVGIDGATPLADLTVGFKTGVGVTFNYFRAFALGENEPTVGTALGETVHRFVIPNSLAALRLLAPNDIAAVSGNGSLTLSADVSISLPTNPLVSIDLPLAAGPIAVRDGLVADLSASFQVEGSYQLRARKLDQNTVELLYAPEKSTTLQLGASASAGISVQIGQAELISALLGAIDGANTPGAAVLATSGLSQDEAQTFGSAVKAGLDRSLAASINQVFSSLHSHEAAFVYELKLDQLTSDSQAAIESALHGDLSRLNRLEKHMQPGGTIAAGVRLIKTVLGTIRDTGCTLNINLLGIVNFTSLTEFVRNSEVVTDSVTGDVTLKETITGNRISAIIEPFKRDEALRKALFDSVVATLLHSASGMSNLEFSISGLHFALNQNTNLQNLRDYLGWFSAFGLLADSDGDSALETLHAKGMSTCLIRSRFDPARTASLFLTSDGVALSKSRYVEIGSRALIALLDPVNKQVDRHRKTVLENQDLLARIIEAGAASNARLLLHAPANVDPLFTDIYFDAQVIAWWASSMADLARSLARFKASGTNFEELGRKVSSMLKNSPVRFDQPWGLLALSLLAVGQRYGRITSSSLLFERSAGLPLGATAGV